MSYFSTFSPNSLIIVIKYRPPTFNVFLYLPRAFGFAGAGCFFGLYSSPSSPNSRAFKITFAASGAAVREPYPPPSTTTAIAILGRSIGATLMNQLSERVYVTGASYSSQLPSAPRRRFFTVLSLPVFSS